MIRFAETMSRQQQNCECGGTLRLKTSIRRAFFAVMAGCLVTVLDVSAAANCLLGLSVQDPISHDEIQSADTAPVDFDLLISQLDVRNPSAVRIEAAKSLGQHKNDPRSLSAVDALISGLEDPDDEARYQSLANLSFILAAHKRECPIEIFELLDDETPKIKTNFWHLVHLYDKFPPGALRHCLDHHNSLTDDHRSDALVLLAKAGGKKNKTVMKILFDAVNSDKIGMRTNGAVALWTATNDFEILLPLHFDLMQDYQEIMELAKKDKELFKRDDNLFRIQIAHLSVCHIFNDHLANRHDVFVESIETFAESRDVDFRRKCALYLAICTEYAKTQIELRKEFDQPYQEEVSRRLAELNREMEEKRVVDKNRWLFQYRLALGEIRPAPSELFDCDYSRIQKIAAKLADDPDQTVSRNAKSALKHIETLKGN